MILCPPHRAAVIHICLIVTILSWHRSRFYWAQAKHFFIPCKESVNSRVVILSYRTHGADTSVRGFDEHSSRPIWLSERIWAIWGVIWMVQIILRRMICYGLSFDVCSCIVPLFINWWCIMLLSVLIFSLFCQWIFSLIKTSCDGLCWVNNNWFFFKALSNSAVIHLHIQSYMWSLFIIDPMKERRHHHCHFPPSLAPPITFMSSEWQSQNFTRRGLVMLIPAGPVPVKWSTVSFALFSSTSRHWLCCQN